MMDRHEAKAGGGAGVRIVGYEEASHRSAAGRVIARAFFDDPVFSWFFPDDRTRMPILRWVFDRLVLLYSAQQACFVGLINSEEPKVDLVVKATALCNPPLHRDSIVPYIRNGIARLPIKSGLVPTLKVLGALGRQGDLKELIMADCQKRGFWYLGVLAVDIDCQGKGIGTRMLEHFIKRADDDDVPAYLETARERNVGWYERYGFRVVLKEKACGYGPPVWYMRREAKSTHSDAAERLLKEIQAKIAPVGDMRIKLGIIVLVLVFVLVLLAYYFFLF